MKVLSLEEAVNIYGNQKQKEFFLKRNGNLDRNPFNALIKTIQQHYEVVTVEGRGSKRMIKCDGEYPEPIEREDGRSDNQRPIPYEYELNRLVINYLSKRCEDEELSKSLNMWMNSIGLVPLKVIEAFNNKKTREKHLLELSEIYNDAFSEDDMQMLYHFITKEIETIRSNLKNVFRKLSDKRIIIHTIKICAMTTMNKKVELDDCEIKEIADMIAYLCEKHSVTLQDVAFKHKDPDVIEFKYERDRMLEEMGYKYTFESHGCFLQAPRKRLEQYLDRIEKRNEGINCFTLNPEEIKQMVNEFKEEYSEHSLNRASYRQENHQDVANTYINYKRKVKQYMPMWERLLVYYKIANKEEVRHEFPIDKNNPFVNKNMDNNDDL